MAKTVIELPDSTIIDVVTISKGIPPLKRTMTIYEAKRLPTIKGVRHIRYQLGFSSY